MNEHKSTGERPVTRAAPYRFRGTFYEACDCYTICPCWTGGAPDDGGCARALEAGRGKGDSCGKGDILNIDTCQSLTNGWEQEEKGGSKSCRS